MPVTLRDVSRESGFSVTTVSRALNGYDDVNEETRRHIEAVARQLGYIPNLAARQLQTRRAHTIGYVIPTAAERLNEPFFREIMSSVSVQAARHRYDLLVSAHEPGNGETETYRRLVQSGRVDGLILVRARREDPRVRLLRDLAFPFVLFGRSGEDEAYPWIDVNGKLGMRLATEHLLSLGHRRIAFVSGPPHYSFVAERENGYRQALDAAGLPVVPELIVNGAHITEPEGRWATRQLLALAERPTAIIALTDLMAYGVMRELHRAGCHIGREIAVVGFDGLDQSAYTMPPLTTVSQPITEISRKLVKMLLRLIASPSQVRPRALIDPTLVIRESSTGIPDSDEDETAALKI